MKVHCTCTWKYSQAAHFVHLALFCFTSVIYSVCLLANGKEEKIHVHVLYFVRYMYMETINKNNRSFTKKKCM